MKDLSHIVASGLLLGGLIMTGSACGDDGGAPAADAAVPVDPGGTLLDPPEPGAGYQYVMTTELSPGTEVEHCQFVVGPPEGMYINRDEVRYSPGSHHFLLYETAYSSIPTMTEDGTPFDTSGVFDCTDGPTSGWRVNKLIGGSQNADGTSMVSFPPDVAMYVPPGAVLLMNAHYINASDAMLEPEVNINLYTIPEEDVSTQGDILFLYNPLIHVPAGGPSRARWRCPVNRDITIVNAQSHMHARGVGYAAMIAGEEPFYTNDRWEGVPVGSFEPGLEVAAGSQLDYYCDYMNPGAEDVNQGQRSTDEMCMLIGSYYPADPTTANCLNASGELAAEWVGDGTETCAQSLNCVVAGMSAPEVIVELTKCMMDADPAVAREISRAAICVFNADDAEVECADEIADCQAI